MNEIDPSAPADPARRGFVRGSGLVAAGSLLAIVPPAVRASAWAAGTDAPEKADLKVGFIPLTDCASIVIAATEGFDRKYGIKITPIKRASWASVRDGLLNGELDAAHALYGLVYGVQMGIGGLQRDMAVLMTLNRNGQGITLSNRLRESGVTDGSTLAARVARDHEPLTFAQTFPTGTHAMWLYYWLAAQGVHPLRDVNLSTIPPVRMVDNLQTGRIDGCCVGEPWNARAVQAGTGFTAATSQAVWPNHPEKVLGATAEFVERYPNTARALVMALLEASRYIDMVGNRSKVARVIAADEYVGTDLSAIEPRFLGHYHDGLGHSWIDPHPMQFHADGAVNFPYLSDGMWFLTQQRRWGLLRHEPDYRAIAERVNRVDLYREAAQQLNVPLPSDPMRSSTLVDGVVWDGREPARYAAGFAHRYEQTAA